MLLWLGVHGVQQERATPSWDHKKKENTKNSKKQTTHVLHHPAGGVKTTLTVAAGCPQRQM
jgi:hypothetical protein